jgi:hypothetical protein
MTDKNAILMRFSFWSHFGALSIKDSKKENKLTNKFLF